jgi:hypothetical protein
VRREPSSLFTAIHFEDREKRRQTTLRFPDVYKHSIKTKFAEEVARMSKFAKNAITGDIFTLPLGGDRIMELRHTRYPGLTR